MVQRTTKELLSSIHEKSPVLPPDNRKESSDDFLFDLQSELQLDLTKEQTLNISKNNSTPVIKNEDLARTPDQQLRSTPNFDSTQR